MSDYDVTDRSECVAAFFIDFAEKNSKNGGLRIPFEDLPSIGMREAGIRFDSNIVNDAMLLLIDLGFGEIISVGKSKPYFLIDSNKFARNNPNGWYANSTLTLLDDGLQILRAFRKLGSQWLFENINILFKEDILAQRQLQDEMLRIMSGQSEHPISHELFSDNDESLISSASWTGRYIVSKEGQNEIFSIFRKIEIEIDNSILTNTDKSNAKALVEAANKLISAPDPQWEILLQILSSTILANFAALAALAIAIIKP
jgi:hypothetical protein